jgi:hypothetical protein
MGGCQTSRGQFSLEIKTIRAFVAKFYTPRLVWLIYPRPGWSPRIRTHSCIRG